jgi:predicted patatin/cPLA2 family phospholipase
MSIHALVVQGGGFRTAFSAGVLDAFLEANHNPFKIYAGVSGGAISMSYYIASQQQYCIRAIEFLSANRDYMNPARILKSQSVINVDIFHDIADLHMPYDYDTALQCIRDRKVAIVMTDRNSGMPHYHRPDTNDWKDAIIASCAFPFASKGKHELNGTDYMDGAWSDPIPVEWAVQQGATDVTLIRTDTAGEQQQSWLDKFGELYYRNSPGLKKVFATNHENYNRALRYLANVPEGICVSQIAPQMNLKSGVYTDSKEDIRTDYQHGLEMGRNFLTGMNQ